MILKQNEIEKAAIEQVEYVVQEHTPTEWNHQQLKDLLKANFEGSVKWAESKFEEIAIEFAKYSAKYGLYHIIHNDGKESFQQFIKERNEK